MKNIDLLLNKYWECETTLEEEKQLQQYFTSGNVASEHEEYSDLFYSYDELGSMTTDIDVAAIFESEAAKEVAEQNNTVNVKTKEETKVFTLKRYIPAIAASIIGILGIITLYNKGTFSKTNEAEAKKARYVILEDETEQEEAIRVTREALQLLSKNYKKGTDAVSQIKHIEAAPDLESSTHVIH